MTLSIMPKWWYVVTSLFIALFFQALPDTVVDTNFQPMWVMLVVTYWAMYTPDRFNLTFVWFVGLLQDVLLGMVLGQYALVYVLLAVFLRSFHLRIKLFSQWKQHILVVSLIFFVKLFIVVENYFLTLGHVEWKGFFSVVTTGFSWLLVRWIMDVVFNRAAEAKSL